MSSEIQPADERLRFRLLLLMTLAAALGAVCLHGLDDYFTELHSLAVEAQPAAAMKAKRLVLAILGLATAGSTLFSLYLGRVSWRILRSGRFPPPGARVLSDTRVCHGRRARRRGLAGLALALLTLGLTVAIVARGYRIFDRLFDTTLKPTRIDFEEEARPDR